MSFGSNRNIESFETGSKLARQSTFSVECFGIITLCLDVLTQRGGSPFASLMILTNAVMSSSFHFIFTYFGRVALQLS